MRKLFVAALLLVTSVARAADIPIQGTLGPNGTFPIVHGNDVEGGLHEVADIAARDAIPVSRLVVGMMVYVVSNTTLYQLASTGPSVWAVFTSFGGLTVDGPLSGAGTPSSHLQLSGVVPIANGGTNLSSAGGVANRLLVTTDGSTWAAGTAPNAALANSSITVAGTAGQISVSGGGPVSLGGTTTLSLSAAGAGAATYTAATGDSFTLDAQGRVSAVSNVTRSISTTAGDLTGGGNLTADRTLALATTAVTPSSYGDGTHVATFTVDSKGRLTAASSVAITNQGTVTSVGTGNGLQGGTITSSGTVDLRLNASGGLSKTLGAGTNELGIDALGVTNAMLAGSIANAKLANSSITVTTASPITGAATVSLGGTLALGCATCITGTPTATGDLLASTSGLQGQTPIADVAAGSYLRSGGVAAAPVWSTVTLPNAATQGDVLYATAANTVGRLADVAVNQVLLSGGVGASPAYGTVPNAALTNSSITLSTGTGISVSGSPVSLGGTATITNTGVTSAVAGSGITVSGATGAVTFSIANGAISNAMLANSSITVTGGTGISVSGSPVSLGGTVTPSVDTTASLTWTGTETFNTNTVSIGTNLAFAREVNHTLTVDASTTSTTVGGNLTIRAGAGSGAAGGNLVLDAGANGGGGTVTLAAANAASLGIGHSGVTTTITGGLTQLTGAVSLTGNAASSFTTSVGALTLDAAAALSFGAANATSIPIGHSGITTTVTGGLTQLTGAFSLTGNGASSATTSSGALTLTGGASSTWGVSTGQLTLNAPSGLEFQFNGINFFDIGVTSSSAATSTVGLVITTAAGTGSPQRALTVTPGNHTSLTASTEASSFRYVGPTQSWATGDFATQRFARIGAPTYQATAGSTITKASTFAVEGAPVCNSNMTCTNAYSIWAQAGLAELDGGLTISGALTQATGAVSLTANAASSLTTSSGALTLTSAAAATWSTSAGALTLTSAAAATWSTGAGALTLNGSGGTNLQAGGSTLLDVGVTTGSVITLAGNLNTPNDIVFQGTTNALTRNISTQHVTANTATGILIAITAGAGYDAVGATAAAPGGALQITGGVGGAGSASVGPSTGGNVTIAAGAAGAAGGAGGNANGGSVTINGGALTNSGTKGQVLIGASNTASVTITPNTTVTGTLTVANTASLQNSVTFGTSSANLITTNGSLNTTLNISQNAGGITFTAAQPDNNSNNWSFTGAAGGAFSSVLTTGGTGQATSFTSGAGGAGDATHAGGNGGTMTLKGGAGANAVTGGSGGAGTGGGVTVQGGNGGAGITTTAPGSPGGTLQLQGGSGGAGAGAQNPGAGGALTIVGGTAAGSGSGNASGGAILIDGGVKTGTGVAGTIGIGTNQGVLTLGKSGNTTTVAGLTKVARITESGGTSVIAGDFVLSSGWGSTASVGTLSGTDGAWDMTVTTAGIALTANPTITFTFHDGTWTSAPVCLADMRTTSDATAVTDKITYTRTATTLTLTFNGTPIVAQTYVFSGHCMGVQ